MSKIFVRERRDVNKGAGRPRFAVVGVEGSDLKFFRSRIRRAELETIAERTGVEVVFLPPGGNENKEEKGAGGDGKRRRRKRRDESS